MGRDLSFTALAVFLAALAAPAEGTASSVLLRYGFTPGAVYRVTEQHHDVGKIITEMNVMGQQQKFESPTDQVSSGTWTLKAVAKSGESVRLHAEYGTHKGGERWASEKVESGDIFGNSAAEVTIHPIDGAVDIKAVPAGDPTVEIIYTGRFAWMPRLPKGELKEGGGFTHEYVLKSGMYNVKVSDEYYLAGIKGGFATFDVETRQIAVIRMSQGAPAEGLPAGMGMNMGDMTIAYKGDGTAVFDIRQGIFVEREGKMSYSNMEGTQGSSPMPGGMAFSSRMEGVTKYRFEMERE